LKDQNPIRTARRKARQDERENQGIAVQPCPLCIEEHHTAGRNHDAILTAPLCQKHHRQIHEELRKTNVPLRFESDRTKRVATALKAAAVYGRALADAMERWAGSLLTERGQGENE